MKLKNLTMSSTKAFALVDSDQSVTASLQAGWDVRFDYLLIPPLVDPVLVSIPGYTILVHNGSTSTIKLPVAGAFSKWNWLEWPITVIVAPVVGIDRFVRTPNLIDQLDWDYVGAEPLYRGSSSFLYFETGIYNSITKVGLKWDNTGLLYTLDDRQFDGTVAINNTTVIRECPPFSLPHRIQLRITLVRVQEN
jgi:hypothetical protein